MIARIAADFDCSEEELWERIIEPKSLQFIASPLLSFQPIVHGDLNGKWIADKSYELKLYLFKILYIGRHRIRLVKIDRETNTMVSNESGTLARVWNHTITFHQKEGGGLRYVDEIEIKAGWLTVVIWAFAHIFYRHRQRRWKVFLKKTDGNKKNG